MIPRIRASVGRVEKRAPNASVDVALLQNHLTTLSELSFVVEYDSKGVDGEIGRIGGASATVRALEAFQRNQGLSVDGIMDPCGATERALVSALGTLMATINDQNPNVPGSQYFPFPELPGRAWTESPRSFGASREGNRAHAACDLYFPEGTWIYAMEDGVVVRDPYHFYNQTYALEVDHGTFLARYGEIRPATPVSQGDRIVAGQKLAMVGHLVNVSVESDMLHLETYAGTATGPLTVRTGPNLLKHTNGRPFQRRRDLLDPTERLNQLANSLPIEF